MIDVLFQLLNGFPVFNTIANLVLLYFTMLIYGEVRKTNGRLIRLETWQDLHERQDNERHQEMTRAVRELSARQNP